MFEEILEDVYKLKTSDMLVPEILDFIYEKEQGISANSICYLSRYEFFCGMCLRDIKEWLYRMEATHINTYAFRRKIDDIKRSRGLSAQTSELKTLREEDEAIFRDYLEAGMALEDKISSEVFREIYKIFFQIP